MTLDIDFGIEIEDWESYSKMEIALKRTGLFKQTKEKHRFLFDNTMIDIIPFGNISNSENQISWPPEYSVIMSVSGFEEVYQHATPIIVNHNPYVEIKVPTLPGLAVLKILSWKHAYPERPKDAEDLLFIIKNYEHTDIMDRLFKEKAEILESESFDYKMASIRINFQRMLILPELKPTRSMAFLLKFTVWRKHWLTVSNFGIKSVWISFWNLSNSTWTEKKSILQG